MMIKLNFLDLIYNENPKCIDFIKIEPVSEALCITDLEIGIIDKWLNIFEVA